MLTGLIYSSSARKPFTEAELIELLANCRAKNALADVTGMLLYHDGNFIQLLEGETETVSDLYHKIEQDPRHHSCTLLIREPIESRSFPEWTMGFHELGQDSKAPVDGFKDVMSSSNLIENSRHTVKVLLNGFKSINQM